MVHNKPMDVNQTESASFLFDLPRDLRRKSRAKAAEQEVPLSAVIRGFLTAWVDGKAPSYTEEGETHDQSAAA